MKYLQFPRILVTNPAGNWASSPLYKNITNSYVLIMGLTHQTQLITGITQDPPFYSVYSTTVVDVNNNTIGTVDFDMLSIQTFSGTIPVWNGTSMENETAMIPLSEKATFSKVGQTMIPPQATLMANVLCSVSQTIGFGGWGLLLEDDELIKVVSRIYNVQEVINE
ncbi:MAG: hypothetical protein QXE05_08555 [Nitrososphaeria archaeon]